MKTQIINSIKNILGINALLMRIETLDTLVAVQRKQIAEQKDELDAYDRSDFVVRSDIEDFLTERDLERSIDEAIDNYDWDSIVSDALSERNCSRAIEEAITDAIENFEWNESTDFAEAVLYTVKQDLAEQESEIASAIKQNATDFPVA